MATLARVRWRHLIAFLLLWTLLVLYPNPYRLLVSVYRMGRPPIEPAAVGELVDLAPEDPAEIERFVLREFPYQYDWQTFNIPWYFPTVPEAMENRTGDCKTRFVVLASLLEALDIPYRQTVSPTHFWIDYEGKEERGIEKQEYAWMIRDEEGTRFQVPREDADHVWDSFKRAFWEHMPAGRKVLFVSGPPLTALLGWLSFRARQSGGRRRKHDETV